MVIRLPDPRNYYEGYRYSKEERKMNLYQKKSSKMEKKRKELAESVDTV